MTNQEREVYEAAVEFVELHGGIVIDPHETKESIITKIEMMDQDSSNPDPDLEDRIEDARKSFMKMLGSKRFSYSAVEDMMLDNGLEMDYIEDIIHNM